MRNLRFILSCSIMVAALISLSKATGAQTGAPSSVASAPTRARAADGRYISWREHIVDDEATGGVAIRGGDGLQVADLDKDVEAEERERDAERPPRAPQRDHQAEPELPRGGDEADAVAQGHASMVPPIGGHAPT